jgi:hypothetical protein
MADYANRSQHQTSRLVHGEEIHPDGVDAPPLASRMLHRLLPPGARTVKPPLDQVAKECEAHLNSRVRQARRRQRLSSWTPVESIQTVSRLCNRTLLAAAHTLINLRLPHQLFRHPDLVVALRLPRVHPQTIADHRQDLDTVVNVEGGTSDSRESTTCFSNQADLETVEVLAHRFVVAARTDSQVRVVPRPKALDQEHPGLRKRVADRVYPVKVVLIF